MKHFYILTLFKENFENFLNTKAIKTAISNDYIEINFVNIRDFLKSYLFKKQCSSAQNTCFVF